MEGNGSWWRRAATVVAFALALYSTGASALPPDILSTADLSVQLSTPPEFFDRFGTSLAVIGDVDGNGAVDIAVGAPGDDDGGTDRGAVYVLLLDAAASVLSTVKISATSGGFTGALDDDDGFGSALVGLGDIDGDGVADLAVGAIRDDDGALDAGAVWILTLNSSGAVETTRKLSALTLGMEGALAKWDYFGSAIISLEGLLEVGNHGLAVGARGTDGSGFDHGAVWVLSLDDDLKVVSKRKIGDATAALAGKLAERGWFGASLARSGSRIAVGAPGDETVFATEGILWLLELAGDGSLIASHRIVPVPPAERFGGAVGFIGDFDFDGIEDLAVGRPNRSVIGGSNIGSFEVLLMKEDSTVRESRRYPMGAGMYGRLGAAIAVLPDFDRNLIPEVLAGAPDAGAGGEGSIYFLNGISAPGATCGDPTGDGVVNATDALLVLRASVRLLFCELLYCDADQSGRIGASDALLVLHAAVVSQTALSCPTTTLPPTTSTTLISIDECFSDEDCMSYGDPERLYCCGYQCAECTSDEHCPTEEYCRGDCVCVPRS
jgi:hypothetical protein